MKLRNKKKPTNKELQKIIEGIQYELMATQSQLGTLTQVFSDFLDYTHKKAKFVEYLKSKQEKAKPGSVENNVVEQESLETA